MHLLPMRRDQIAWKYLMQLARESGWNHANFYQADKLQKIRQDAETMQLTFRMNITFQDVHQLVKELHMGQQSDLPLAHRDNIAWLCLIYIYKEKQDFVDCVTSKLIFELLAVLTKKMHLTHGEATKFCNAIQQHVPA